MAPQREMEVDAWNGRARATRLLDLEITTVGGALNFLHVVCKVCVLQAQVDSAFHALVALGQLLGGQALKERAGEQGDAAAKGLEGSIALG